MDYLENVAKISVDAEFTEKEKELFISLTNPLFEEKYDFIELYHLFEKMIKYNQGDKACKLYEEKQKHFKTEPSAYPELEDDVRVG